MKIPRDINGAELANSLRQFGYEFVRQTGSHISAATILKGKHNVTIPNHRPIKVGTLKGLLKAVARHHGLSLKELLGALKF